RLRERIIALPRDDKWRSMARSALRDDLYTAHAALTRDVLVTSEPGVAPEERMARWSEKNKSAVQRAQQTLSEIWESDSFDLATLSVALGAIRTLVPARSLPSKETSSWKHLRRAARVLGEVRAARRRRRPTG